jgi:hypothetical protein
MAMQMSKVTSKLLFLHIIKPRCKLSPSLWHKLKPRAECLCVRLSTLVGAQAHLENALDPWPLLNHLGDSPKVK